MNWYISVDNEDTSIVRYICESSNTPSDTSVTPIPQGFKDQQDAEDYAQLYLDADEYFRSKKKKPVVAPLINQAAIDSAASTWKRWFVAVWYPGSNINELPDFCAKDVDPETLELVEGEPTTMITGHTHLLYCEEYGADTSTRRLTVTERINIITNQEVTMSG